jgi:hypothetical protein
MTAFEPYPSLVRNIFICSGVVVLRLVEDNERIVQGPAPHEGQRGDFDDALVNQCRCAAKSIMSKSAS